jgi:hypothetical protein
LVGGGFLYIRRFHQHLWTPVCRRGSRQKTTLFAGCDEANVRKTGPTDTSWQKPRLLPAAKQSAAPHSAEIAAGNFCQLTKRASSAPV